MVRVSLETENNTVVSAIYFRDAQGFLEYISETFGAQELERAMSGRDNNIVLAIVYSPKINNFRDSQSLQFEIQYYK